MAKTNFVDKNPAIGQAGTTLLAAFLNKIFNTSGGHKHDGADDDGSAAVIVNPARVVTANTTINKDTDHTLYVDASAGPVTITMCPLADVSEGREFVIEKIDTSANAVSVTCDGAEKIEARSSAVLALADDRVHLKKRSAEWMERRRELIGSFRDYAGGTVPYGFALCYGQAISRTQYAKLFAHLGTTYGTGDGSTTFNLPDMRGRVRIGKDDMGGASANRVTNAQADVLGGSGGAEKHTLTSGEMPVHNHSMFTLISGVAIAGGGAFLGATSVTGNAGSGEAHNNMQPWMAGNVLIKF